MARLVSLHKRGERTQATNYRGISISNALYRVVLRWMKPRLDTLLQGQQPYDRQYGFTPKKTPLSLAISLQADMRKHHHGYMMCWT